MANRIKVTGYIRADDLEPEDRDDDSADGLSAAGYDNIVTGEQGNPMTLAELEDIELEREG